MLYQLSYTPAIDGHKTQATLDIIQEDPRFVKPFFRGFPFFSYERLAVALSCHMLSLKIHLMFIEMVKRCMPAETGCTQNSIVSRLYGRRRNQRNASPIAS
ncbi:MAG: hypothetical protein DBY36_03370 [Clostridiales bacterium]|nr:MAG: hypothetical protein DBY36_06360 [Clostridiales bacterium]PWL53356.1 MAG: hypothetical protein DBY36_03370 [Clostridiales bacterium]